MLSIHVPAQPVLGLWGGEFRQPLLQLFGRRRIRLDLLGDPSEPRSAPAASGPRPLALRQATGLSDPMQPRIVNYLAPGDVETETQRFIGPIERALWMAHRFVRPLLWSLAGRCLVAVCPGYLVRKEPPSVSGPPNPPSNRTEANCAPTAGESGEPIPRVRTLPVLTAAEDLPSTEPLPPPQVSTEASAQPSPTSILELDLSQIATWLKEHRQPTFRAKQIWKWIYQGRADSFHEMTDLPLSLRQLLSNHFRLFSATCIAQQGAEDGTQKLLLQLVDGGRIECVLLRDGPRRSICVSSQVGCAMGCVFCASGLEGVERNLSTAEIIEQMLRLQRLLPPEERLSHIVMMGMGEPLANLSRVLPALEWARSVDGLGISPRRITISTVGLPHGIDRLAATASPYQLAISLHAPNDPLRNRLVPVNQRIGIEAIMEAADRYFDQTGRRLTFEYVLLADINDDPKSAQQLVQLLRGRCAMLNVIPYNPVAGLPYQTPSPQRIATFRQILLDGGLNVLFRQRKGDAIQAACGQLRHIRKLSRPDTNTNTNTNTDTNSNTDADTGKPRSLASTAVESGPP